MGDPNWAPMTEQARTSLLQHRQTLSNDLDAESIVDQLISDFALSPDEAEEVTSKTTRRRKADAFLNLIGTKGQHAYNSTHSALKKTQPHLCVFFEDNVTGSGHLVKGACTDGFTKAQAEVILRKGGVPVPPAVFTPRIKHIEAINTELQKLKDPGWVVVHGMGGIGKSVLAAASVRDPEIISDVFPGGLYWLSIGKIDKAKLLSKVQNLCARLEDDQDRTPPHNLEEGKDRLRTLFLEKHPRSLLILDDVWSTRVIHTFDVQARVMVTTRDQSVTERVSGPVHSVLIDGGFSEEQALETLAKWTKSEVQDLPAEARTIYEYARGSPLVISILGALLADHPNRWKFYLCKLQHRRFDSLKKATAYEYDSVGKAIGMSLEQLEDQMKKIYSSFAIFSKGVPIPATVLAIMHGEEPESIEDMMEMIIKKSLAYQEWNQALKCMTYTLHDLQMDYLIEQYKNEIKAMNKQLVQGFKNHCNGEYFTLPDDTYIHMYLAEHMANGDDFAELSKLLRCLRWITIKISLTGPANMLSDYVSYVDSLAPEDGEFASQFQSFISVNAHLLIQNPLPDILQLALVQQDDTEVCQRARALIKAKQDGFYLEWCNKYLVKDHLLITNTPHSGVTMSAHFSPTGDHIISCGEDGTVKLWETQSLKPVLNLDAHNNWINWCEISPLGDMIITCSSANVKMWRRRDQKLLEKISGDWLRAIISHDGEKVAMCSTDGHIQIIDLKSDRRRMIRAHDEVVRAICFTPDDSKIVSCSDDSVVKVFDVESKKELVSYPDHTSLVVNCCVSPDGQRVASAGSSEVHVWDLKTGKLIGKCLSEADSVLCCEFSPKGDVIAGGLSSFEIVLWETKRYKPVAIFKGHTSWVMSVKFDVKGERLVSASDDETVRTWKVEYGHMDLKSVWKRDFTVCFGGDQRVKYVVAADTKNRVLMTDGREADKTFVLSEEKCRVRTFALSGDKTKVAYGSDGGKVKIVDIPSKTVERSIDAHSQEVRVCTFPSKGYTLVTCSNDNLLKIWREDESVIECAGHMGAVSHCQIYDNDSKILSSSYDGTLKIWELSTGRNLETIDAHADWIFMCEVSPDHKMAASVSVDREAKIWDLKTLNCLQALKHHIDSVRTCRFSPDNRLLATGDDSGVTRIWSVETGVELGTCSQHNSWVTDIKFSPDSKIVVTCGENVRWWKTDGTPLQTFHIRGSFIRQVQADEKFRTFVTVGSAGILYLMCRVEFCDECGGDMSEEIIQD